MSALPFCEKLTLETTSPPSNFLIKNRSLMKSSVSNVLSSKTVNLPFKIYLTNFYKIVLIIFYLLSLHLSAFAQVANSALDPELVFTCIDQQLIDPTVPIPALYQPVCGCDGVTYPNAATARYRYGITSWTDGVCRQCDLKAEVVRQHTDCDGGDVCISISGGTAPYTLIFGHQSTAHTTNNLEICFQDLPPGNYTLKIIDAQACEAAVAFSIPVIDYYLEARIKDVSCFGGSDGAIDLIIQNNTPLLFSWTGPNGFSADTEDITDLIAGVYRVKVTTLNGECYAWASFEVNQPTQLEAAFSIISADCQNGVSGCLKVTGGTHPYKLWVFTCPNPLPTLPQPIFGNNDEVEVAGMQATDAVVFEAPNTGADYIRCARNIPPGVYYVLVADANRCWTFLRIEIPDIGGLRLEGEVKHVSCFGGNDGAIELHVEGGQPPYRIRWEKEDGTTGTDLNMLTAGIYKVWVVDANECVAMETFIVRQPDELMAEFVITSQDCDAGTDGCLKIKGGTKPYHLWAFRCPQPLPSLPDPIFDSNGQPQVLGMDPTDALGFEQIQLANDVICAKNIPAGIYYVLIVDANRCWIFKRIKIEDQPGIRLNFDFDPYGSFACVDPVGGNAPYLVEWFDFSTGEYITSDDDYCVKDLSEGIYSVEVTDANGCSASHIFVIESTPCKGGTAIVDPSEIQSGQNTNFILRDYNGLRIQWQFKTDFTDWLDIPGATSDHYVTPPISVGTDKRIAVRAAVSCADGTVVLSSVATLTVFGNDNIDSQSPASDRNLFNTNNQPVHFDYLVTAYPSITKRMVQLRMNASTNDATITLANMQGKTLKVRNLQSISEGQVEMLDLSVFSPGIYLIRVEMMGTYVTKRVILQKP